MRLKHDPFPLIFDRGEEFTRFATLQLFDWGESPRARSCLLELIKQQRADGAFPSRLDSARWGMRETVRSALLLLSAGLPSQSVNVNCALRHVLSQQRRDGGWTENPALDIPPEQTWLSGDRSIVWLCADVVALLRQVGQGHSQACRRALKWLRSTQNERGGWPSLARRVGDGEAAAEDPDATAQIAFLMGQVYGVEDPVHLRGKAVFEQWLDECAQDAARGYCIRLRDGKREPLDVYHLTHLLLSWLLDPAQRIRSGYDANDRRVRVMMETLMDIQREDGGWRPFFAEESSPRYTALAVRVLVLSGMLEREDLEPFVEPHAA